MAIMNQLDALSAKEGTVFFTINDKQYELAELISLEAKIEYTKADVTPLNSRMKGGKIVGAEGTGTVKMYYHRPELKKMALEYVKKRLVASYRYQVYQRRPYISCRSLYHRFERCSVQRITYL